VLTLPTLIHKVQAIEQQKFLTFSLPIKKLPRIGDEWMH